MKLAKEALKLSKAKETLNEAENHLNEKTKELQNVEEEFIRATSQKKVNSKFKKKVVLNFKILKIFEDEAASCRNKISSASELINSLSGERERWPRKKLRS